MVARYDFNSNSSINGEYGLIERFGFSAQRQASAFETENENGFRLKYRQDWIQSEDDLQMN